jgi:hypothetical protein
LIASLLIATAILASWWLASTFYEQIYNCSHGAPQSRRVAV